jgi:hypothetical protein
MEWGGNEGGKGVWISNEMDWLLVVGSSIYMQIAICVPVGANDI